jgi:transposase InsO family protein
LEEAFHDFGPPKHIISDKGSVFTGGAFCMFLREWGIEQRFGAVGKHGSIAVTERVIKTFKYEWLKRVSVITSGRRLGVLCAEFLEWYNCWRPHMKLGGLRPDDFYHRDIPEPVPKDAKTVPKNIETRFFKETRITGFRLKDAA